jgi:hypothetical protein
VGSSDQSLPSSKVVYEEPSEEFEAPVADPAVEEQEAVAKQTSEEHITDTHADAEPFVSNRYVLALLLIPGIFHFHTHRLTSDVLNNSTVTLAAEFKALFDTAMQKGYLDNSFLEEFDATMSAGTASSGASIDDVHNNTVMEMTATTMGEGGPQAEGHKPANTEPITLDRYVLLPPMPNPAVRQHMVTETLCVFAVR